MKKKFLVVFFLFAIPSYLFASKYASIGFGPNIGLRGYDGTNYLFDAGWHPHENVGARLIIGFVNGFWAGPAIDFSHTEERIFKGVNWTINSSIPFIVSIRGNITNAYIGFTLGNTFSFDLNGERKYYLYITPAEFFFTPVVWKMSAGGFDAGMSVSIFCSAGFRIGI